MPYLINAAQLDKFRKAQKNVVILDATCRIPASSGDARQEYLTRHIQDSRFFDIHAFADHSTSLPNMLSLDETLIADKLGELGITKEHKVIFYDNSKMHTSCRALWMMKVFGHNPNLLYIFDGGVDTWEKYGGKVEAGEPRTVNKKEYQVSLDLQHLRALSQMKENLRHPSEQVVDVRNPKRFAGAPEDRPGLRAGHMPGSFCFPFTTMFEADGRWKSIEKIRRQLVGIGVDLQYPIVTSCGSGTTAPILNFVLDLMNHDNHAMYDGSWSEWGAEALYPGETSLAERPVVTSLDT